MLILKGLKHDKIKIAALASLGIRSYIRCYSLNGIATTSNVPRKSVKGIEKNRFLNY
jgi:hypothetical protein